ncbi:hypothetical protein D6C86_08638 [Aureobasidium pullulans]|nr:hypothetical protein D6C86_08638 [Aureobasidium pullulans]THZ89796.1 hypothetical protein D6C88_04558 [Aureobasidium pullulans]
MLGQLFSRQQPSLDFLVQDKTVVKEVEIQKEREKEAHARGWSTTLSDCEIEHNTYIRLFDTQFLDSLGMTYVRHSIGPPGPAFRKPSAISTGSVKPPKKPPKNKKTRWTHKRAEPNT